MAADDGNSAGLLKDRLAPLLGAANRMGFFQLVSLLERMTSEAVRVGGDGPPGAEVLRFRHDPALTFSAGDINAAVIKTVPRDLDNPRGATRQLVELSTTFLGLTGAVSPLPLYIADEINHEEEEQTVRRDFLDVFHHRLISLLYRSVQRYSPAREHRSSGLDPWMRRALSLTGMDPEAYVPICGVPAGKLLKLGPLIAGRGRGARALQTALEVVLEDHLSPRAKITLTELVGGWVQVHQGQRCSLGVENNALGLSAMLGVKVFDRSGRFQVSLGPVDAKGRRDFSEGGAGLEKLRACVGLLVPEPLDYDLEILVEAGATELFRLSTSLPARLGETTRLGLRQQGEVVKLRNVGRKEPQSATA